LLSFICWCLSATYVHHTAVVVVVVVVALPWVTWLVWGGSSPMRRIGSFDSSTATAAGEWHIRERSDAVRACVRACGWTDGLMDGRWLHTIYICKYSRQHMTMLADYVSGLGRAESGPPFAFFSPVELQQPSRSRAAACALASWLFITYIQERMLQSYVYHLGMYTHTFLVIYKYTLA